MATDLAVRETKLAPITGPRGEPHQARPVVRAAVVPLALVALSSVCAVVERDSAAGRSLMGALAAGTVLAFVSGHRGSARLGLGLTAVVAAAGLLPEQVAWWPLPGVVGAVVYTLAHVAAQGGPSRHAPLRLGGVTAAHALFIVALVTFSSTVLVMFARLAPPRLGTGASFLTDLSLGYLVAAGVAFAVVNATVEEILFRGAIQHHLSGALNHRWAVLLQAVAFGILHMNGYPYGLAGVVLATVYGLLLGALRLHSGGLLAPWIAHACADVVIFVLIVRSMT